MKKQLVFAALAAAVLPAVAMAQPVGLNGLIGAEWAGVTPVTVAFDPNAATSNFGTPGTTNHVTAYEIFLRRDANFLYTALRTTSGNASGYVFANLYYSLRSGPGPVGNTGSSIGFEVLNDRAFSPGNPGYYNDGPGNLLQWATSGGAGNPDIIESAIDLSVFLGNALNVTGFGAANPVGIRLNLSQSFGYSVAGGPDYGEKRLGYVSLAETTTVPEPSTYALFAAGLAALGIVARRRRNV